MKPVNIKGGIQRQLAADHKRKDGRGNNKAMPTGEDDMRRTRYSWGTMWRAKRIRKPKTW